MPGIHKNRTLAFRPDKWERALIEERAALSGMNKKDFLTKSCIYSNIVVVGKKEVVKKIVDSLHEMQYVMKEIAEQLKDGDFSLSETAYNEMKMDYLALVITIVDIANGAAYLLEKEAEKDNQHWKSEQEVEQLWKSLNFDIKRK